MRIIFVGRHSQANSNQDEEAVTYALRHLGHDVVTIEEEYGRQALATHGDILLCNKWGDTKTLRLLEGRAKRICWYWDRVMDPDPMLARRSVQRRQWMEEVLPHVDLCFCTDGDHVAQDRTGKLVWLMQGADERRQPIEKPENEKDIPILFTGAKMKCGAIRESFVNEMKARYKSRFVHFPRNLHGEELAKHIARAKIVVAPDGPLSGRYCSNRVFLTLGLGGFLLHPWCEALTHHYEPMTELIYYKDRKALFQMIDYYLEDPDLREKMRKAGHEKTRKCHLYRHRCEKLIQTAKEWLCLVS